MNATKTKPVAAGRVELLRKQYPREYHQLSRDEVNKFLAQLTEQEVVRAKYTVENTRLIGAARRRVREHGIRVTSRTYLKGLYVVWLEAREG